MSSNISITRVCQHCNNPFTAHTTVTKYCSMSCTKKDSKLRLKNVKIEISNKETFLNINKIKEPVKGIQPSNYILFSSIRLMIGA